MIVIASDNQKVVNRWSRALRNKYQLHIVNQKSSLFQAISNLKPRLLLLDIALPRLRAVRELPDIQKSSPSTKILVLSKTPTLKEGLSVLKAGAHGYASVNLTTAQLRKAATEIVKGQLWFGRKILSEFVAQMNPDSQRKSSGPTPNSALNSLSGRKCEIANLVVQGIANKDISAKLNISQAAVKAQLTQIYRRFGVPNRIHLALLIAPQMKTK